jgi:hypothetical protein
LLIEIRNPENTGAAYVAAREFVERAGIESSAVVLPLRVSDVPLAMSGRAKTGVQFIGVAERRFVASGEIPACAAL